MFLYSVTERRFLYNQSQILHLGQFLIREMTEYTKYLGTCGV